MSQAHAVAPPAPEELYVHLHRDLGTSELWERSLVRSRERRARASEGAPRRRTLLSEALLDLDAPPLVAVAPTNERDLTSEELWDLSGALARARRRAAAKPVLTQARTAGASLMVAAIAASAPLQGSAHTRSSRSSVSAVDTRLLRSGSRGPDVASVQRKLRIPADGIFGPQTRRAVKRFQARHGLAVDGIVGPKTRAALARSGSSNGFRMFRAAWVDDVQRKLGIPADGVFGPQTRAAVMAFQARKGLVVDGIVGPRTLAALGLSQGGSSGGAGGAQSGSQSDSNGTSRAATAARAATSQIGDPYAWGGDGPSS
ncbi:MAG: peptidoglycan-binding protein, partial [Actinobacteria bacterium]|nr:peptidoglycan-binding protein [Actinomycetota bacterium]